MSRTTSGTVSSALADHIFFGTSTPRYHSSRPIPPSSRRGKRCGIMCERSLSDAKDLGQRQPEPRQDRAAVEHARSLYDHWFFAWLAHSHRLMLGIDPPHQLNPCP